MLNRLTCIAVLLLTATTVVAQTPATTEQTPAPAQGPAAREVVGPFLKGDRILFLGDDVTQQMFYTRAVATAFLSLYPQGELRFFNGGWDGATPATCATWVDDLLELARPNVVFVMFGFNTETGDEAVATYRRDMKALTARLKQFPSVRHVILLGPLAFAEGLAPKAQDDSTTNQTLRRLNDACAEVAQSENLGFIEMYSPMKAVYMEGLRVGGAPLTFDGRHPTETAHMVIAGIILAGLEVSAKDLDHVGWSPMLPRDMARIRPALTVSRQAPSPPAADSSRTLYLSVANYDHAFFGAWRLTRRKRFSPQRSREEMMEHADNLWKQIDTLARELAADAKADH